MSDVAITAAVPRVNAAGSIKPSDDPAKIRDAAQQFESLLMGQILSSVREGTGGGWLGSGEDSSGAAATGFAEQQLATMMSQKGGLGLAKLISEGLERGR
jgi:Rod binding domain-containing protein